MSKVMPRSTVSTFPGSQWILDTVTSLGKIGHKMVMLDRIEMD